MEINDPDLINLFPDYPVYPLREKVFYKIGQKNTKIHGSLHSHYLLDGTLPFLGETEKNKEFTFEGNWTSCKNCNPTVKDQSNNDDDVKCIKQEVLNELHRCLKVTEYDYYGDTDQQNKSDASKNLLSDSQSCDQNIDIKKQCENSAEINFMNKTGVASNKLFQTHQSMNKPVVILKTKKNTTSFLCPGPKRKSLKIESSLRKEQNGSKPISKYMLPLVKKTSRSGSELSPVIKNVIRQCMNQRGKRKFNDEDCERQFDSHVLKFKKKANRTGLISKKKVDFSRPLNFQGCKIFYVNQNQNHNVQNENNSKSNVTLETKKKLTISTLNITDPSSREKNLSNIKPCSGSQNRHDIHEASSSEKKQTLIDWTTSKKIQSSDSISLENKERNSENAKETASEVVKKSQDVKETNAEIAKESIEAAKKSQDDKKTMSKFINKSQDPKETSEAAKKKKDFKQSANEDAKETTSEASKKSQNDKKTSEAAKKSRDDKKTMSEFIKKSQDPKETSVAAKKNQDLKEITNEASKKSQDPKETSGVAKESQDPKETTSEAAKRNQDPKKTSDVAKKSQNLEKTTSEASKKSQDPKKTASEIAKKSQVSKETTSEAAKKSQDVEEITSEASKKSLDPKEVASEVAKKSQVSKETTSEAAKKSQDPKETASEATNKCKGIFTAVEKIKDTRSRYPLKYVEVQPHDLNSLNDGRFLNDTVIDFYLSYIYNEKLSRKDQARTYFCNTYFYRKLANEEELLERKDATLINSLEDTWLKDVDLFSKDFIIIPKNITHSHWYLIIICFLPKLCKMPEDDTGINIPHVTRSQSKLQKETKGKLPADNAELKRPCICFFDSLDTNASRENKLAVAKTLENFLKRLWSGKHKTYSCEWKELISINVICPQQVDAYNCGVFMLQFVESFFKKPITDFRTPLTVKHWFTSEMIAGKRKMIKQIIEEKIKK